MTSRPSSLARRARAASAAVTGAALLAFASEAAGQDRADDDHDSAAYESNEGFNAGLGPMIILPTAGGSAGGGLDVDLRYGIPAGPTIIAPGGRVAGYYISSERFVGLAMPTARVTLPIGPFAPYGIGGVGAGGVTDPGEGGLAVMGGGGLMIHFGRIFGLGVEATYQTITQTEFSVVSVGPLLTIGT